MQFFQPRWKEQQKPHQLQYQRFRVTPAAIPFSFQSRRRGAEGIAAARLSKHGTSRVQRLAYFIRFAAKTKGVTQPDGHTKDKHL